MAEAQRRDEGEAFAFASNAGATPPKDIFGRLMDLTCGWYEFTEEHKTTEHEALAAELFDLYQSVAGYTEAFAHSSDEVKEAVAVKFVYERIIPALLKK